MDGLTEGCLEHRGAGGTTGLQVPRGHWPGRADEGIERGGTLGAKWVDSIEEPPKSLLEGKHSAHIASYSPSFLL